MSFLNYILTRIEIKSAGQNSALTVQASLSRYYTRADTTTDPKTEESEENYYPDDNSNSLNILLTKKRTLCLRIHVN